MHKCFSAKVAHSTEISTLATFKFATASEVQSTALVGVKQDARMNMEFPQAAFLPIVALPSKTQPRLSNLSHSRLYGREVATACARQNDNPPTSNTAPHSLRNALCATAAASLLAFTAPSLPQHAGTFVPPAQARGGGASFLSASGEVIKDPEALLRWSLPIENQSIRSLQSELEGAVNELRGLKWSKVESHVKRVLFLLNNQSEKILTGIPEVRESDAATLLTHVADTIPTVESAVAERNADKVTQVCRSVLRDIGGIEQLMVRQFPYQVPEEYASLPQLRGRATVEMIVRKGEDAQFDINGIFFKEGKLTLVLDGYSAPVSAGNFVDLVNKGFYDKTDVVRSDGFIVQAGKPEKGDGYVDVDSGKLRTIPLEVFAKGDREPTYGMTLEDDGRGAERTVLPFTSYGTLAVARNEFEANSASSQFFWFLFEPDLTPAGRNLMDGNWAVMGYTTEGENYLQQMQKGDQIVSANVVDGIQNLASASPSKS